MLFDAHCHLDSFREISIPQNITAVTSGHSHASNLKNAEIASRFERVYCSLGIAPQTAMNSSNLEQELPLWAEFVRKNQPSAIGEIGLDYHWGKTEEHKKRQRTAFEALLSLADEMRLPVVIHSRNAGQEVLETLLSHSFEDRFMMHCFSGSISEAKRALDLGGLISIPPIRSKDRKKTIKYSPLQNLVIETDAPYIGKTLLDIRKSAEMISELKEIPFEKVEEITYANAGKFFKIKQQDA